MKLNILIGWFYSMSTKKWLEMFYDFKTRLLFWDLKISKTAKNMSFVNRDRHIVSVNHFRFILIPCWVVIGFELAFGNCKFSYFDVLCPLFMLVVLCLVKIFLVKFQLIFTLCFAVIKLSQVIIRGERSKNRFTPPHSLCVFPKSWICSIEFVIVSCRHICFRKCLL